MQANANEQYNEYNREFRRTETQSLTKIDENIRQAAKGLRSRLGNGGDIEGDLLLKQYR